MRGEALDVAVVGGGPAGLAAAWELSGSGARVTIYERRQVAGGWLRTEELDGARADVGAQLLAGHYRETVRLAGEVGATDLLVRAPGKDALWRGGRGHVLSYGSVASLAVSSALPTALKFRLASRYLPYLKRHAALLDPNEPVRAASLDGESIAEWGQRELGPEFVELMVYPQLAAFYGCTPEETSAAFYHTLANSGLQVQVYGIQGGLGELAAAVVRSLEGRGARVRTGVEVSAVRVGGDGVEVGWGDGAARHDAVVVALPAPMAARTLAIEGPVKEWLAGVRASVSASLALLIDRLLSTGYFGLSFPRSEPPGGRAAALCVESQKGAALATGRQDTIVVYPAPAIASRVVDATPREVLDLLLPAVEQALPGIRARVIRAKVYKYRDGGTLFYPGYLTHLRSFRSDWLPDRLALAGDYLVAPTIEGAVRSGRRAAAHLLRGPAFGSSTDDDGR